MQSKPTQPEMPFKYEWQQLYFKAIVEVENNLPSAIETATETIIERKQTLMSSSAPDPAESEAIADALANLRALKRSL